MLKQRLWTLHFVIDVLLHHLRGISVLIISLSAYDPVVYRINEIKSFGVAFDFISAVCALQYFSNRSLSQFAKPSIYILLNM